MIGSVGGVLVGFWFARQPRVAAVFDPYVKMVNALPRVVLAPIFTLWLGLGIWSKVALGVTLVFFIVFFNVYQGVKEVSTTVLDNGRMLGMNERQLTRHVYWPSALSWMFSSLHTSVGFAVVGAVVGEYLGSAAGLGYLIQQAEGVFDVGAVFAGMFVLSAFVILIDIGVTMVERRLLVWRPAAAEAGGRSLPSLRAKRRSNPFFLCAAAMDCFACARNDGGGPRRFCYNRLPNRYSPRASQWRMIYRAAPLSGFDPRATAKDPMTPAQEPSPSDETSLRYAGWRVVLACFLMALFLFGFGALRSGRLSRRASASATAGRPR